MHSPLYISISVLRYIQNNTFFNTIIIIIFFQIQKSGELVGFYVGPEVYCKLILPTVQAAQGPGVLMTFASILLGTKRALLKSYLLDICKTLAEPDVCRSEEVNILTIFSPQGCSLRLSIVQSKWVSFTSF